MLNLRKERSPSLSPKKSLQIPHLLPSNFVLLKKETSIMNESDYLLRFEICREVVPPYRAIVSAQG